MMDCLAVIHAELWQPEAQQQRIAQLQAQETELRTQAQTVVETECTRLADL